MKTKNLALMICLTALIAGTASSTWAQQADSPSPETVNQAAHHYVSTEGDFQVTWPSGCGKLRIRENDPNTFVGEEDVGTVLVRLVNCDRDERPGEGCSVVAYFDELDADGGEAGPDQVMAHVRQSLASFGVKIVKQTPIKREFEDGLVVEGVDVLGTTSSDEGQFWVRGLLSYHDIYILTAWSTTGEIWTNPEFQEFFNGFLPYAE